MSYIDTSTYLQAMNLVVSVELLQKGHLQCWQSKDTRKKPYKTFVSKTFKISTI